MPEAGSLQPLPVFAHKCHSISDKGNHTHPHMLCCKRQEDAAMNIGRNILYFRQQQGMTQQQLADALGIAT